MNLGTALRFCSMSGSLESFLNLEKKMRCSEVLPGVLPTEEKYGYWKMERSIRSGKENQVE